MADTIFHPGRVFFANPPKLNEDGIPITKTKGKIKGHPIIVIKADAAAKTVTGVMVQSFQKAGSLTNTPLDAKLYKWFLPVTPAVKESIHAPIPARPGSTGSAEWVNLKDNMIFTEDKVIRVLDDVPISTVNAIEAAMAEANK